MIKKYLILILFLFNFVFIKSQDISGLELAKSKLPSSTDIRTALSGLEYLPGNPRNVLSRDEQERRLILFVRKYKEAGKALPYSMGYYEETFLQAATALDHTWALPILLEIQDPDYIDGLNRTALTIAATRGHDKAAEVLLDSGAKVNLRTRADYPTALSAALLHSKTATARLLRRHGAELDLTKPVDKWAFREELSVVLEPKPE